MNRSPQLDRVIRQALAEDLAGGDVTTNTLVAKNHRSGAVILSKQDAVLCGLTIAKRVFTTLDPGLSVRLLAQDGQAIKKNQKVLMIKGPTRSLLTAERVALNFLSYLSAIATKTSRFVQEIKPFKAQILDTRKTTPTLRFLERYAVRCGGGRNHRDNLNEMILIKDNHLLTAQGPLRQIVDDTQKKADVSIEVEVDTIAQLREVLMSRADIILLDNMPPATVRKAVQMRNRLNKAVLLEASGGITLKNVRHYAQAGVDRISIGQLTHSREAVDFSMEVTA
jgi:nicotinate-nucleotide pyrophosphorylase (carboxylating)